MEIKPGDKIRDVSDAFDELTKTIREDADLYHAYQANIAMAFQDEYNRCTKLYKNRQDIHRIANEAAKNFLNLWTKER